VSWFEAQPTISLDLIQAPGVPTGASIIDVGGGASRRWVTRIEEVIAGEAGLVEVEGPCRHPDGHPALASE
jgi:hypothetical protein